MEVLVSLSEGDSGGLLGCAPLTVDVLGRGGARSSWSYQSLSSISRSENSSSLPSIIGSSGSVILFIRKMVNDVFYCVVLPLSHCRSTIKFYNIFLYYQCVWYIIIIIMFIVHAIFQRYILEILPSINYIRYTYLGESTRSL